MKKTVAVLLSLLMVLALCACTAGTTETPAAEEPAKESAAADEPAAEEPAAEEPAADAAPVDPNTALYTYIQQPGEDSDINTYYNDLGVDCDVSFRGKGGTVSVAPEMDESFVVPVPNESYTIGFSIYYTVDEVGAMMLSIMEKLMADNGVTLLVNDANYDQNVQNQTIEQWIVEGVDGVIICPCDFYGVSGALDSLKTAGIPVVTVNPPLEGEADCAIIVDAVEQGRLAGEALVNYLLANGSDMTGEVVYQTLPFVHPNAATRTLGFKSAFEEYPGISFVELTGTAPEEHYTAFEGAMQAYPDMLGAWGLYSSATIGMLNAAKAAGFKAPITSIDNDKVILEAVYNGELLGSCCNSASTPAYWAYATIINLLNGVEVPGVIFYGSTMVTKDNVEEMYKVYYPTAEVPW